MKKIISLFTILFSVLLNLKAQPFYFERIDIKDGLSQNTVNEIIQDSRGFMWFGTKDGLNRYDGNDFKVFKARPYDRSTIGNNQIRTIMEDRSGNILVGTNAGLWRYDVVHDTFSEIRIYKDSVALSNPVLSMTMDAGGRVYVSVEAAGVYRYDPETQLIECKYSTGKPLHTLQIDESTGTVWMSWPGEGLCYTEDDFASVHKFLLADGSPVYPDDIISCISIGGYNRMYLGLEDNGVVQLDMTTAEIWKLPLSDSHLFVRRILQFSSEELWIGSESGLYIYNLITREATHVKGTPHDHYSLSDNAIHSLCKDKDGGVWVGTFFGGVNYLPERVPRFRKWYYTDGSNGLYGMRVKEICPDGKGCLWIGTEDAGLYHFNPLTGKFRLFGPSREFSNIHGLLMHGDDLWVSTFSKGIKVIDTRTWNVRHYDTSHPSGKRLFSNYVFALAQTKEGRIYIGTMHGLQFYNEKDDNFGYVPQINGGKMVNDIMEDSSGNLWVATVSNGLYMRGADRKWKRFLNNPGDRTSLPANNVLSIFEDSRKQVWITTEGSGFSRFDNGTFKGFTSVDGLPSDVVYHIVEDEYGKFWISTNKGLVCFDPEEFSVERIYNSSNGILCNQFNYKSGWRSPDGTIYFGSIEGLIAFKPKTLLEKKAAGLPAIYITDFSLLDGELKVGESGSPLQKDITSTESIRLNHDCNTFALSFAALDYKDDKRLVYKMQGLDNKWLEYSGSPVVYSNVPPGNYTFTVRLAEDLEGVGERTLKVKVKPSFWWSVTARILYSLLLLAAIMYGVNWYHRRALMKRSRYISEYEKKKELEIYNTKISFFTNVTHEIRTPLTLIKAPLDNILAKGKANAEIREDLGIISRNADRLLALVNQLLDFEKIEKEKLSLALKPDKINDIVGDVIERFRLSFRQQGKDFVYDETDMDIVAMVDREAFTKIVSNMLTNALKYSESRIRVSLCISDGMCRFVVSNDGEIIPENKREAIFEPFYRQTSDSSQTGTGIGLYLARQLAELQRGTLSAGVRDGMNEFVLLVPLCGEAGVRSETASEPGVAGAEEDDEDLMAYIGTGDTVLVVEDDLEMCGFIRKCLEETWEVLTAHNGLEALEVLEKKQVTLIVSDIMMPGMDGIQFCKTVKKDFRYNHIPIILLTAKTGLESRIKGMNVGADAYIEKPFSLPYLKSVITNQIKSRKILREVFAKSPLEAMNTANLTANDTDFLAVLQKIVYDNISNAEFRIDDAIDIMNMGRATFYRKIKGIFDMSPNDYLRLERLKVAADLLKRGTLQINEVCYMVGFTSPSYFTKCFTRQFGESPKRFMMKENGGGKSNNDSENNNQTDNKK